MIKDAGKLKWWLILVVLACAGLYLLGNGQVPLWDRDEGWYAQCSKQMWESGDYVVPYFLDQLRTEKPVFVYWLQLGGYWLFGGPSDFAVRFYAAVAQSLVVAILGWALWSLVGPSRGVWAAFIYGSCVLAIVSAKMCLTDATLMVFVVTAQLCLMSFYLGNFSWSRLLLLFLALGFGGLTKGPVALIPPLMTIFVLALFDWRRWTPLVDLRKAELWNRLAMGLIVIAGGLLIIAAVSAPWLIELNQRAPEWIPRVFNAAKAHVTVVQDGHKGPFGYYMALVWGTYFPWSLLLPTAAYVAWKQRHVPQTRFAIAAVIGPWFFFELMKTKLPHYPLPTFPFISLLVADALIRCARSQYLELFKPRFTIAAAIWMIPVGLLASAPWLALFLKPSVAPLPYLPMTVVSLTGFVVTVGTWWFFQKRKPLIACAWLGATFLLLIALLYGWLIPQSQYLQTASRVAQVLARCDGLADKAGVGDVITLVYFDAEGRVGYYEPTLAYYQGGTIRTVERNRYLEETPFEKWPRVIVLTSDVWNMLDAQTQSRLDQVGTVRGYLYSDEHKVVDVIVATKKASATASPTEALRP